MLTKLDNEFQDALDMLDGQIRKALRYAEASEFAAQSLERLLDELIEEMKSADYNKTDYYEQQFRGRA